MVAGKGKAGSKKNICQTHYFRAHVSCLFR
jgi:hypothetical protein